MKKCMRRVCTQCTHWGQNIRSMTHAESKNRHNYRLSRFIVFSDTLQISSGETIVSAKPNVGHRLLITDILPDWSHRHARCFWFPNEGNNFMWMNLENKGNVILNIPPCLEKKHLTAHKLSALYNAAPWEVNRRTAVKTSSTGGLSRLPQRILKVSQTRRCMRQFSVLSRSDGWPPDSNRYRTYGGLELRKLQRLKLQNALQRDGCISSLDMFACHIELYQVF